MPQSLAEQVKHLQTMHQQATDTIEALSTLGQRMEDTLAELRNTGLAVEYCDLLERTIKDPVREQLNQNITRIRKTDLEELERLIEAFRKYIAWLENGG